MTPESSMALIICSSETFNGTFLASLLMEYCACTAAALAAEYCDWALLAALAGGWDFLEHPDHTDADNINVTNTKTPFTLFLI
jgi:hypothetical protein